jgi:ribosomal protein S18 acetylase RimI-like enzyme
MIARVLAKDEWARLAETELPALLDKVRPEDADVLVVEDVGRIVGCVAAVRVTHLEGLWIAPEYRGNAGLGRRLLRGSRGLVGRSKWVWAGAASECMRSLLSRLGAVRLPLESYVLKVEG